MYKRVKAQLILSGISRKKLASALEIGYNTLNLKLNGKRPFTLNEAAKIKRVLNATESIETLFDVSA